MYKSICGTTLVLQCEFSLLQTNVPEPFSAFEADKLKEGVPEGLSDTARERGQRWAMEDRLEYQQ